MNDEHKNMQINKYIHHSDKNRAKGDQFKHTPVKYITCHPLGNSVEAERDILKEKIDSDLHLVHQRIYMMMMKQTFGNGSKKKVESMGTRGRGRNGEGNILEPRALC